MLGHEDIAVDMKSVALPQTFECVEEHGACVIAVQVGETAVLGVFDPRFFFPHHHHHLSPFILLAVTARKHVELLRTQLWRC